MEHKKNLVNEYFTLKTIYDENAGKDVKNYSINDSFFQSVSKKTVNELKRMILHVKEAIREQEYQQRVKEFYYTDEGIEVKKQIITAMNGVKEKAHESDRLANDYVSDFIKEELGKEFGFHMQYSYNSVTIEVGIIESNNPEYGPTFIFGHTFFLDYDINRKDELRMNYPSPGSFDLFSNVTRNTYVIGMGKIAGCERLKELKKFLHNYIKERTSLSIKYNKIDSVLKDPFKENDIINIKR